MLIQRVDGSLGPFVGEYCGRDHWRSDHANYGEQQEESRCARNG